MSLSSSQAVEGVYMRVLNEIDKALTKGDIDRAQSMAKRGALGQPKVLPELVTTPEVENDN